MYGSIVLSAAGPRRQAAAGSPQQYYYLVPGSYVAITTRESAVGEESRSGCRGFRRAIAFRQVPLSAPEVSQGAIPSNSSQ
eukprot:SAG31_NODE_31184_length_371_cov_0.698529_1_plen_80_part_01